MTTSTTTIKAPAIASESTRWGQLAAGIVCMVMIANLQYGWTLFVNPIDQKYHWGKAAIQVAFTVFVLTETWLVPFEGYLVDKYGPRVMIGISGILVAIAWVINAFADSIFLLYVGAAVGGIGAGVIYGGSVGNALKWFPDRRGLAAGLTAAGFGAGSALTVVPIANMIQESGYEAAFLWFGLGQGLIVIFFSFFLRLFRFHVRISRFSCEYSVWLVPLVYKVMKIRQFKVDTLYFFHGLFGVLGMKSDVYLRIRVLNHIFWGKK